MGYTTAVSQPSKSFGLWSGIGLVMADMIGAGVFLSTGFMAQSMTPGLILLAWVVGAVLAMAGARAYAEVARLVPRGGGEYRYLSELLHPSLGYLAGWASLLVGFSAPIALDALAAGAFARAVLPTLDPLLVGACLIVALTLAHAVGLRFSTRVQNGLVLLKVGLVVGFIAVGLFAGSLAWPSWAPPDTKAVTLDGFANQLFYIAFAYSGWNAAVYAADEFTEPRRDVPRAMLLGTLFVAGLYLLVNYIFVANLTPELGAVVFNYDKFASLAGQWDQVTLGQAVMGHLLGPAAAKAMSLVTLLIFISAMSAMALIGPRVYAAMARDGVLPKWLQGQQGKPPAAAVFLQGGLAMLLLFTHQLREVLSNVGAILTLFAALTVLGLFAARLRAKTPEQKPAAVSLVAAGVYVGSATLMLFFGFKDHPMLLVWVGVVAVVALGAYAATKAAARRGA